MVYIYFFFLGYIILDFFINMLVGDVFRSFFFIVIKIFNIGNIYGILFIMNLFFVILREVSYRDDVI